MPRTTAYFNVKGIENSVQYVLPDGFFCIQIVQNSTSAEAPPLAPLGAYDAPQTP